MPDFETRRIMMVDSQVRPAEVTRFPILEALLNVPRERFVPEASRETAYLGENLPIGPGRVLLEPRTFAKFLETVDIQPGERVLHIAAGLGYGAAVTAHMGAQAVALEDDPVRVAEAEAILVAEAAGRARVHLGPLTEGAPALAPFDVILIEGAVEVIPEAITAQLAENGRIAALFAEATLGTARVGRKEGGQIHWRYAFNAGAPVLPGFGRAAAFVL